ncbi:acireductone synthase [Streptomyces sp. HUAS TT20]|uniref:acireductone synthase n=1 Tax=Streptomyces sp. HUAS TT20 TaxID=3447509 RepID=UPI0021DA2F8D|nr:acireductone synthase [Streptomyces sp. HUAS 15-9]UXY30489.1 acireductone synthase [Streptomyces sp. HUAS 15-9]
MTLRFRAAAVVLDIEGTTSATRHVTDVLYPYSRRRFARLLTERQDEPEVRAAVEQVRELLGEPEADARRVERALDDWLDEDRKVTPLKTLQGIIWAEGFARGELTAHFYPDVVPALRRWHERGTQLYVYSSGSVSAQRSWFGHTAEGDLRRLVSGFFDTRNAGPKTASASYRAIAAATGVPAADTLFLSDRASELDAAREAGWLTGALVRPQEPRQATGRTVHPAARSFTEIDLVLTKGMS